MSSFCISLIFLLLVIFIIILLSAFFQKKVESLTVSCNSDYVEIQLRELLKKYPKSEIYIANISKTDESYKIIEKLTADYPQIHIKD